MPDAAALTTLPTHEVTNQPPAFEGFNAFVGDRALVEALHREGGGWAEDRARRLGALVGDARVQDLARLANRHGPELRSFDRFGRRIDSVEFHPAWHELMALAFGAEVHSLAWTAGRPGGHVARGVLSYLWNQVENGVACPTGMAYAAMPVLRAEPALAAEWEPRILSTRYDPRRIPARDKTSATIGMTFTEKQGGSDLRANATRAEPAGDGGWVLHGHKWFFSAPMSDVFVTVAYTERGATCFLVPWFLPDGSRNRVFLQRLKDKLGNRSNASSEIEYHGAWAQRIGEEGHGIRTAVAMAHLTRLDFAIGSAGLMRRALSEALHHAGHRRAFQRRLIDLPLMNAVLADLALEVEAALVLTMRLARAADETGRDPAARLLERIGTPVAKYWICKRAPTFVAEAMECLGGAGYVEESPMPRLYREAPLNGIWEGSGNVICLDVLRAARREPDCVRALLDEVRLARGADRRLDALADGIEDDLRTGGTEGRARRTVEQMALALQASLLIRHAPACVAEAFCASRLGDAWTRAFGTATLEPAAQAALVERAMVSPD